MPDVSPPALARYLASLFNGPVTNLTVNVHGTEATTEGLKEFGYGAPLFIECDAAGTRRKVVLETVAASPFGHDHFADRAQMVLWEHDVFNDLPRHVRSLDCGAFLASGEILSTGAAREFFLVTEFADGEGYFRDLERIRAANSLEEGDRRRTGALAAYLAEIHGRKSTAPSLYARRVRDLLGHGECIMGIIDNYPPAFAFIDQALLRRVEEACVAWRWRIKDKTHRLAQVHGDFHPWNILFRKGEDFTVLDRSRGAWGEPADDVTCLSVNYLLPALLRHGRLEGPFAELFALFWEQYLSRTDDRELLAIAAPFFAWRCLVIASPVWYPHLPEPVRRALFTFLQNVLQAEQFDPQDVNQYLR